MVKRHYMAVLLIVIFSFNAVWGMPLHEAHPKKLIDKSPAYTELYAGNDKTVDVLAAVPTSLYQYDNQLSALIIYYQASVFVAQKIQTSVFITISTRMYHSLPTLLYLTDISFNKSKASVF